ncbi:centromere protein P-like isoform X2 [Branchiostoma lanceolatum]|uniref:centromere protein P-like isoform X2 n=1 Tax=Branchiostoma lanceolatum TaxID=7740 RepID=UPI0034537306
MILQKVICTLCYMSATPLVDFDTALLKKSKATPEQCLQYRTQITQLQDDINSLEEEVQAQDQNVLAISDMTLQYLDVELCAESGAGESQRGNFSDQIYTLDHELRMLSTLTGIQIQDHTTSVVRKEQETTVVLKTLLGQSHSLSFHVELEVEEELVETSGGVRCTVTRLQVSVDKRVATQTDLQAFITWVEQEQAVLSFFRLFSEYSEWWSLRHNTFLHFKDHYSDVVRLPMGPYGDEMEFSKVQDPGACFIITWLVTVSSDPWTAIPNITLKVKAKNQMRQLDEKGTLQTCGEVFQDMVRVLGLEQAIHAVIRTTTF